MRFRTRYDWNKAGEPRITAVNRYGGWLVVVMAVTMWPFCLYMAVTHDWTLALAPLLPTAGAVVHRVAVRKVYGIKDGSEEGSPVPVPEPRVPRDTSRPYPRPKGHRSKLNRACPVCGTGNETGDLDGKVLGWPAHRTCAEWLGDWKPKVLVGGGEYAAEPFGDHGTIPPGPVTRSGSTNTTHYTGSAAVTTGWGAGRGGASSAIRPSVNLDGSFPIANAEDLARAHEMAKNGLASVDEVRERIPDPVILTPKGAVTWSTAGDRQPLAGEGTFAVRTLDGTPSYRWRCACGATAFGTTPTEALARDCAIRGLAAHAGECPLPPF